MKGQSHLDRYDAYAKAKKMMPKTWTDRIQWLERRAELEATGITAATATLRVHAEYEAKAAGNNGKSDRAHANGTARQSNTTNAKRRRHNNTAGQPSIANMFARARRKQNQNRVRGGNSERKEERSIAVATDSRAHNRTNEHVTDSLGAETRDADTPAKEDSNSDSEDEVIRVNKHTMRKLKERKSRHRRVIDSCSDSDERGTEDRVGRLPQSQCGEGSTVGHARRKLDIMKQTEETQTKVAGDSHGYRQKAANAADINKPGVRKEHPGEEIPKQGRQPR